MSRLGKAPWSTHSNIKLMGGRREKTAERAKKRAPKRLRWAGLLTALAGSKSVGRGRAQ